MLLRQIQSNDIQYKAVNSFRQIGKCYLYNFILFTTHLWTYVKFVINNESVDGLFLSFLRRFTVRCFVSFFFINKAQRKKTRHHLLCACAAASLPVDGEPPTSLWASGRSFKSVLWLLHEFHSTWIQLRPWTCTMRAPGCVAVLVLLVHDAAAREFTEGEMSGVRWRDTSTSVPHLHRACR